MIKDAQRVKFGKHIASQRKRANWTESDLARAAGLREVTVKNIEKGAFNVPFDVLSRIATVLGGELRIVITNN